MAAAPDRVRQMKRHLKLRASLAERLHSKIERVPESGCWLWTGATSDFGHGLIGLGRRHEGLGRTHRVSWELVNGQVPEDAYVLHKCDVACCCNPSHLYLGTLKDNSRDCMVRGRNVFPDNRGERATWARLKIDNVREIRSKRESGAAYARRFGVSRSAIYEIWRGKNWKDSR